MDLRELWETHAAQWIEWARAAGHDSYWSFHRDQFLQIVPPPGRRTIDIGCGEGRLTRCLKELGHDVIGIDTSPSLIAAARGLDPSMDLRVADAAPLPFDDASADLAIAFMSLHDMNGSGYLCSSTYAPVAHDGRGLGLHWVDAVEKGLENTCKP